MKNIKYVYNGLSSLVVVLGILLFFIPSVASSVFFKIIGIVLLVFGIVKIIGYFSKDLLQLAFQFDLALGIISGVFGVVMICCTKEMIGILGIVFGLYILVDSTLKIQTALDAKKIGYERWWIILLMAVSLAVIGILLFVNPFESAMMIVRLIGINLIIDGVLNFFVVYQTVNTMRRKRTWVD